MILIYLILIYYFLDYVDDVVVWIVCDDCDDVSFSIVIMSAQQHQFSAPCYRLPSSKCPTRS